MLKQTIQAIATIGIVVNTCFAKPGVKSFVKQHEGAFVDGVLMKESDTLKFVPKDKDWKPVQVSGLLETEHKVEDIQSGIAIPVKAAVKLSPGGDSVEIETRSIGAQEWLDKRPERLNRIGEGSEAEGQLSDISKKVKEYSTEFSVSIGSVDPSENEKLSKIKDEIEKKVGKTLLQSQEDSSVDSKTQFEMAQLLYQTDFIEKAQYRGVGSTSPTLYKEMLKYGDGVAKIETPTQNGTGFLIGENVLITCRHVIDGSSNEHIKIFFYPENEGPVTYGAQVIGGDQAVNSTNFGGVRNHAITRSLDLAIVRLISGDESKLPNGNDYLEDRMVKPLNLSSYHVGLNEDIFAYGYPSKSPMLLNGNLTQGGLAIIDPASVHFPYKVTAADLQSIVSASAKAIIYSLMRSPIPGGLVSYDTVMPPQAHVQFSEELQMQLTKLNDFYGKPGSTAGSAYYWNTVKASANNTFSYRPTVGIKASVYTGDSGAPMFSKKLMSRRVVGMIYGGAQDRERIYEVATPSTHEGAIPAHEIVEHIKTYHKSLVDDGTINLQ